MDFTAGNEVVRLFFTKLVISHAFPLIGLLSIAASLSSCSNLKQGGTSASTRNERVFDSDTERDPEPEPEVDSESTPSPAAPPASDKPEEKPGEEPEGTTQPPSGEDGNEGESPENPTPNPMPPEQGDQGGKDVAEGFTKEAIDKILADVGVGAENVPNCTKNMGDHFSIKYSSQSAGLTPEGQKKLNKAFFYLHWIFYKTDFLSRLATQPYVGVAPKTVIARLAKTSGTISFNIKEMSALGSSYVCSTKAISINVSRFKDTTPVISLTRTILHEMTHLIGYGHSTGFVDIQGPIFEELYKKNASQIESDFAQKERSYAN